MDEAFVLCYGIPGISWDDVQGMTAREREWLLERLMKQKKLENPKR